MAAQPNSLLARELQCQSWVAQQCSFIENPTVNYRPSMPFDRSLNRVSQEAFGMKQLGASNRSFVDALVAGRVRAGDIAGYRIFTVGRNAAQQGAAATFIKYAFKKLASGAIPLAAAVPGTGLFNALWLAGWHAYMPWFPMAFEVQLLPGRFGAYDYPFINRNQGMSKYDIELARVVLGDIKLTAQGDTDAVGLEWPADTAMLQAAYEAVARAVKQGFEDSPPAVGAVLDAAGWVWTAAAGAW